MIRVSLISCGPDASGVKVVANGSGLLHSRRIRVLFLSSFQIMSFGFSVGDFMALIQITSRTYQGWKKACGEYTDITRELDSLQTILSRLAVEVQVPTSLLLHHDRDLSQLRAITLNCREVVSQLATVVSSYDGIVKSRRSNWDRIRFSQKNLGGLRGKLILQINTLGIYLDVLGVSAIGRMENNVKELPEMKRVIDGLAAEIRAGRREGSGLTTYENDEKEVWRQFRRELIAEGFSSESLKKTRGHLRQYVRRVAEAGLLDEDIPQEPDSPPSMTGKEEYCTTEPSKVQSFDRTQPTVSTFNPEPEQGDQSKHRDATRLGVKGANDRFCNQCKASSSGNLEEVSECSKQESGVRPDFSNDSSLQATLSRQATSDIHLFTLNQFKSSAELDSAKELEPLRSSCRVDNTKAKQNTSPIHQYPQEGMESIAIGKRVGRNQKNTEDRQRLEHRKKRLDQGREADPGLKWHNSDTLNDGIPYLNAEDRQRLEQGEQRRDRERAEDRGPERSRTAPPLESQSSVSEESHQADRHKEDILNHVTSDPEAKCYPKAAIHQAVRENMHSPNSNYGIMHNPPYPVKVRRSRGRVFSQHDALNILTDHENERKLPKGKVRRSRGRTYEGVDAPSTLPEPEDERRLGEDERSKSRQLGDYSTSRIQRKRTKERSMRGDEAGRNRDGEFENNEEVHTLREDEDERKLRKLTSPPENPASIHSSARPSRNRDKHRPKSSREKTSSSYYEDPPTRKPTTPPYASEPTQRVPRLRRASTTPLTKLLSSHNTSTQTPQDRAPTNIPDEVRAAAAAPRHMLTPPLKEESSFPKWKRSLSKISLPRLSSPNQESSLPRRIFSLSKLSFPKEDFEDLPSRSVRQSRSCVDPRLLPTPPPFGGKEKTRLKQHS